MSWYQALFCVFYLCGLAWSSQHEGPILQGRGPSRGAPSLWDPEFQNSKRRACGPVPHGGHVRAKAHAATSHLPMFSLAVATLFSWLF